MSRRIRIPSLLGILALSAALVACSEDDRNPVGAAELPQLGDTIQEIVLEPVQVETFLTATEDRGLGTLLTGAHELPDPSGFESRVFLRFALMLADTARGPVVVDSARVRVTLAGVSPDSVRFRIHRVTEHWVEQEVSWEERAFGAPWTQPGGTFDPQPLAEGVLAGDSVAFSLPDTLVERWVQTSEGNEGVILLLDTPGAFAQVNAASTTGLPSTMGPRLDLFVTVNDTSSVSDVLATSDAFVANYAGMVASGLAAGNEPLFRSLLKFDVSSIPGDASINLAELKLTPVQVVSPADSLVLELRRVASPFLGGATVFSATVLDTSAVRAGSPATFSRPGLASLIRTWQADSTSNRGLGLQAQRRFGNLGFAVYAGSDAAPDERPRLRIIFTPPLGLQLERADGPAGRGRRVAP